MHLFPAIFLLYDLDVQQLTQVNQFLTVVPVNHSVVLRQGFIGELFYAAVGDDLQRREVRRGRRPPKLFPGARLDPFPGDEILTPYCTWVNAADFTLPWLNNLKLRLTVADQPIAASLPDPEVRKLLFSP